METVESVLPTLSLDEPKEQPTTRTTRIRAQADNEQCPQLADVPNKPKGGFPAEAMAEWARQQQILEEFEAEIKAMEGLIEEVAAQYGIVRCGEIWIIEPMGLSVEDEAEAQVILQLLWTGYDGDQLRRDRENEKEDEDMEEGEVDWDSCRQDDQHGACGLPDYEDEEAW